MKIKAKNLSTKDKLLQAAQELILSRGYEGTSVDDICTRAKVTKGGFFHYFKSKEELGSQVLSKFCANSKEAFLSGCCQKEKDPLKRVYGFLDFMISKAKTKNGKGCLLGSMAQELSDTHPQIRSLCAAGFKQMAAILKKDLTEAKARYAPRAAFRPRELGDHFVAVLEGSMLLARVRKDAAVKASGLKHFKTYIESLFKK